MCSNPIIWADFPDLDVIRVEDTYYMISTTMHFMPGGVILRSYDLYHWELAAYVYDRLEETKGQKLSEDKNIYGKGMWAASLRYHEGIFYVCFVANDTHKTYLYQAENIEGPWRKQYIDGFYHDCSLLFEEKRVYIVYGNKEIYITELDQNLSGPKKGGLHRMLLKDTNNVILGYEGSHIYKINNKYYLFLIHWPAEGTKRRVQSCFVSDSLQGDFVGKDVLDDDLGFFNQGVAQGGIVDTPAGEWYAMLFQDHGAVGRIPVLVPFVWEEDFPVFGFDGKVPGILRVESTRKGHLYEPLVASDDFNYLPDKEGRVHLKKMWQWNHLPENELWSVLENPGHLQLKTASICKGLEQARNTLTQRLMGPVSQVFVTVEYGGLKNGDYAGICALQGDFGFIAVKRNENKNYLVMAAKEAVQTHPYGEQVRQEQEYAKVPITGTQITLMVSVDFCNMADEAEFFYLEDEKFKRLGPIHKLTFRLDHFVGCRVGLFYYSTKESGGKVSFSEFTYNQK
ncbi:beta-xylosidase [Anaerocolumna cellulosilytica]|uniref:Beta-xylosidase n=1 Tax=Anaerocolumna cellulosilytica TaxID=433286 RepID=A0A6S6R3C2_9FIRM|nr:glycoside hydrolase 43 family protein [Anaerocolumna cellulosilytica]MBB5197206.1 beta-xylosidase [Anaerocolumna cellulosilytica]BCJ94015.1 beta-xylosidase [Anaerocolumna cellulosilytica]